MSFMPGDDQWKTADMVEAERVVAERSAAVDEAIAEARSVKVEIKPMTEAEVASLDEAARAPDAPQGLRDLARKVDSGQLTWRDVFDGDGMRDREVRDAVADLGRQLDDGGAIRAIAQAYEAGHTLALRQRALTDTAEIDQAVRDGRFSVTEGLLPDPTRPADDEYFGTDGYLRDHGRPARTDNTDEWFEEHSYQL
jgi:hypothetical protein